jgi:hypothetical protein
MRMRVVIAVLVVFWMSLSLNQRNDSAEVVLMRSEQCRDVIEGHFHSKQVVLGNHVRLLRRFKVEKMR